MKKFTAMLLSLIVLVGLCLPAAGAASVPKLTVELIGPDPINPGDVFVQIKVTNDDTENAVTLNKITLGGNFTGNKTFSKDDDTATLTTDESGKAKTYTIPVVYDGKGKNLKITITSKTGTVVNATYTTTIAAEKANDLYAGQTDPTPDPEPQGDPGVFLYSVGKTTVRSGM